MFKHVGKSNSCYSIAVGSRDLLSLVIMMSFLSLLPSTNSLFTHYNLIYKYSFESLLLSYFTGENHFLTFWCQHLCSWMLHKKKTQSYYFNFKFMTTNHNWTQPCYTSRITFSSTFVDIYFTYLFSKFQHLLPYLPIFSLFPHQWDNWTNKKMNFSACYHICPPNQYLHVHICLPLLAYSQFFHLCIRFHCFCLPRAIYILWQLLLFFLLYH